MQNAHRRNCKTDIAKHHGTGPFVTKLSRREEGALPPARQLRFSRRLNSNEQVAPIRFFTVENTLKRSIREITTTTVPAGQVMSGAKAVIAVYNTHPEAEAAVNELRRAGLDIKKLSVVGKDYHTDEQVVGYYNAGDRMKHWGKMGAFWGGLWGLLFGAAFFWVPGLGPLLVAGPLAASIVAALESAVVVGGLSVLGAALFSIGIPKDTVVRYETAITVGKYLLVAHGTDVEIAKAKEILKPTNPVELNDHVLKTGGESVERHESI